MLDLQTMHFETKQISLHKSVILRIFHIGEKNNYSFVTKVCISWFEKVATVQNSTCNSWLWAENPKVEIRF